MCYYWHATPAELLQSLAEIWKIHLKTLWPEPYFDISPETRFLFLYFMKQK